MNVAAPVATSSAAVTPRYCAFISYSHRDKAVADWLHRALETYRVPAKLVGRETPLGPVSRRLVPIFRDRAELPASDSLGAAITEALAASKYLIVICSPAAARSRWVDQEVATFKRLHGNSRVLALIAAGEPQVTGRLGREEEECFPPSLRIRFDAKGQPTTEPAEPIAADIRPDKDGRRLARLKLVAGLIGVGLDDLTQREAQRRMRRLAFVAGASLVGMITAIALALYANTQRIEANRQRAEAQAQRIIAERENAAATSASDFLIDSFTLANPATENPRTITALTILDRGAKRARVDLANQPALQARLIATLSAAYNALGLYSEAKQTVLTAQDIVSRAGPDGGMALLRLADAYLATNDLDRALATVKQARKLLTTKLGYHSRDAAVASIIEGRVYATRLDSQASIRAFDNAIEEIKLSSGRKPGDLSRVLLDKAQVLSDYGEFDRSDQFLSDALVISKKELGENHRDTGAIWIAMATNALLEQKFKVAEQRVNRGFLIQSRMLDPNNRILADALSLRGQIAQSLGNLRAAEFSLRQSIRIYRAAFKKPHYLTGIAEVYLGLVRSGRGDLPGALAAFDEAKRNYDASYGQLHANHGDLLVNRATVLAKFGRKREARADCTRGLDILGQTLGPTASYTKTMAATCAKL